MITHILSCDICGHEISLKNSAKHVPLKIYEVDIHARIFNPPTGELTPFMMEDDFLGVHICKACIGNILPKKAE